MPLSTAHGLLLFATRQKHKNEIEEIYVIINLHFKNKTANRQKLTANNIFLLYLTVKTTFFMSSIFPILMFMGFIAFIVVIAKLAKKEKQKVHANYQKLANTLQLNLIQPPKVLGLFTPYPKLNGNLGNLPFELYSYTTGGKNKTTYTTFKIYAETVTENFNIYTEGFFAKIGKKFGMKDVNLGKEELDKAFIFKSDNDAFIQALITNEIGTMLLHLKPNMHSGLKLKNGIVSYTSIGHISNDNKYTEFEKMIALAYKVTNRAIEIVSTNK